MSWLSPKAQGGGEGSLSYALSVPEPFPLVRDALPSWLEMTALVSSTRLSYLPAPSGSPGASSRSNMRKPKVQAIAALLGSR